MVLSQLWKVVLISQITQSNILYYQGNGEKNIIHLKIGKKNCDKMQNQFIISKKVL